jgi:type II restriction enzyme
MKCIDEIAADEFSLSDVYNFESKLAELHRKNHNVKAKIRQQLQFLRDKKLIEFLGDGNYRKR